MKAEVRKILVNLRGEYESLPLSEIISITWKDIGSFQIDNKNYEGAVWSDYFESKVLLVVQLERKMFLSFKQTYCLGSLISEGGEIEHVSEEFLWNKVGHP